MPKIFSRTYAQFQQFRSNYEMLIIQTRTKDWFSSVIHNKPMYTLYDMQWTGWRTWEKVESMPRTPLARTVRISSTGGSLAAFSCKTTKYTSPLQPNTENRIQLNSNTQKTIKSKPGGTEFVERHQPHQQHLQQPQSEFHNQKFNNRINWWTKFAN